MTIKQGVEAAGYSDKGVLMEAESRDESLLRRVLKEKVKALQEFLDAFGLIMLEARRKEGSPFVPNMSEFIRILEGVIGGTEFAGAQIVVGHRAGNPNRLSSQTKPTRISFVNENRSKFPLKVNYVFSGRFLGENGSRCVIYVMPE